MDSIWKTWIVFLLIADLLAAVGLWRKEIAGVVLFFIVSLAQLIAYTGFSNFFGNQKPLVVFHVLTLVLFLLLLIYEISSLRRQKSLPPWK